MRQRDKRADFGIYRPEIETLLDSHPHRNCSHDPESGQQVSEILMGRRDSLPIKRSCDLP